jgi:hypothetical protein
MQSVSHEREPFYLESKYWLTQCQKELLFFKEGYFQHINQQHRKSPSDFLNEEVHAHDLHFAYDE